MKPGFEETQLPYLSGSPSARARTEAWVRAWVYCPNCGNPKIQPFPNNSPLADFLCASCQEEFELKSQRGKFGAKVLDGAYKTKCERLAADNSPSLFLMNYNLQSLEVINLFIVPKHFFVRDYNSDVFHRSRKHRSLLSQASIRQDDHFMGNCGVGAAHDVRRGSDKFLSGE